MNSTLVLSLQKKSDSIRARGGLALSVRGPQNGILVNVALFVEVIERYTQKTASTEAKTLSTNVNYGQNMISPKLHDRSTRAKCAQNTSEFIWCYCIPWRLCIAIVNHSRYMDPGIYRVS